MKSEADVIKRDVVVKAENYVAKFDCLHLSVHNYFFVQRACRRPGCLSGRLNETVLREIPVWCEIPRNCFGFSAENLINANGIGRAQVICGYMSMKILLAIDGSRCSDTAVEEVTRRPWPAGSSLKVLTVFEPPVVPTPETWALPASYYEEMDAALRKQGQNIIDSAMQKLKSNKTLSLSSIIVFGSPRPVILDEAESWGADLIVVGSHGYGTWKRLLLGSVSQAVVSHAKCSVEVVRCQAPEKASKDQFSEKSKG